MPKVPPKQKVYLPYPDREYFVDPSANNVFQHLD